MKRSNSVPVLILLMFAVGCGQSKQVEVAHESDPSGGIWHEQYGDLCAIPVVTAGSFVQVEKCNEKGIKLKQVECGDIGKGGLDWPCYTGCEKIRIRGNFEITLGLKKGKTGPVLNKWQAYFADGYTVDASGNWNEIEICVEAWRAKLYGNASGTQRKIGEVIITVKPGV